MAVPLSRLEALKWRFGLLLLLPALALFTAAVLLSPRYVEHLRVVDKTSIPAAGTSGVVRSFATFHPEGARPVPPCLVWRKSGKNSYHEHISGDNRVELSDGRSLTFSEQEKLTFFADTMPLRPRIRHQDKTDELSDQYWDSLHPGKPYQEKYCLSEYEIVWLEGCVKGDQLVGCKDSSDGVLITPGGAHARKTYVLQRAQGTIAFGMLGAVFLFLALNATFRVPRRIVDDLARWRNVTSNEIASALAAFMILGTVISIGSWIADVESRFAAASALGIVIASIVATVMRLRVLGAARRLLDEMQTSRLHSRETGTRELALRIAPDAPTIAGFRPGEHHAMIQFQIIEQYKEQSDNKTSIKTRDILQGCSPRHVPVFDTSGKGVLDTTHCVLDAEPQFTIQAAELQLPDWMTRAVGVLPRALMHQHYVLNWYVAQPGAPLLIYGGVERARADTVDASAAAQYRQTPDVSVVRGSPSAPALVHVGDEAVLVSGIRNEQIARFAGIVILMVTLVIAGATFFWIGKQAG